MARIVEREMTVLLIGYRGSGKSTVGRLLAGQLGVPFIDVDDRIVARSGMSVRDIFDAHGEAGFRRMESAELAASLAGDGGRVVAAGGGAMTVDANRSEIPAGTHVVLLTADPAELHRRITADPASAASRPDLTPAGGLTEVRQLLDARMPAYRRVAAVELDTAGLSPGQVVDRLVDRLKGTP